MRVKKGFGEVVIFEVGFEVLVFHPSVLDTKMKSVWDILTTIQPWRSSSFDRGLEWHVKNPGQPLTLYKKKPNLRCKSATPALHTCRQKDRKCIILLL